MDALSAEAGVTCKVSLHFVGRAITGTSQSDADEEHITRLADQLAEAHERADRLAAALDNRAQYAHDYGPAHQERPRSFEECELCVEWRALLAKVAPPTDSGRTP